MEALKKYKEAIAAYLHAHRLAAMYKEGKLDEELSRSMIIDTQYIEMGNSCLKSVLNVYVTMGGFGAAWDWVKSNEEKLPGIKKPTFTLYIQSWLSQKKGTVI